MRLPTAGLLVVLSLYLTLVPTYGRLQHSYADPRRKRLAPLPEREPYRPSVDVIIPCYNERPTQLAACLESLRGQSYDGTVNVWVVDDGSDNRRALLPVLRDEADPAWRIVQLKRNQGKRMAQDAALRQGSGEIVVTLDSDTIIDPDGIRHIVAPLENPNVGAVTGNLRPSNAGATWLTGLIETRYRLLCEQERAAQGFFEAVLCCAGPFSAYRRKVIEKVWSQYIGQSDRSRRPLQRPGDDLELTNLVLASGQRSLFEPTARASTDVPPTLRCYLRQQRRWNRSFYRELPRMLRVLRELQGPNAYLALDLAVRTLWPALLAVGLAATALDVLVEPSRLPWDVLALGLMAVSSLGLTPSLIRPAGLRFVVLYGLISVAFLLPNRLWAACTLFRDRWETRSLPIAKG